MRLDPNLIIKTFKQLGCDAYATAKKLNINASTVYRWRKKARAPYGKNIFRHTGLKRKSTRPLHVRPSALGSEDRVGIERVRLDTGWDSAKIHKYLKLQSSASSVYRFLKSKGLIKNKNKHRRPLYQETVHMHAKNAKTIGKLQMDVKYITPQLSGLTHTCFEYGVIDIFSRYKQAIIAPNLDSQGSIAALKVILPLLPFKIDFIQTDNGLEFQSLFIKFLKEQNIKHHFIHKRAPNENAVIERSFRTDEDEFFFARYNRAKDLHDLNNQFQAYLNFYNTQRPHFGIDLKTPMEVVANVLKD